MLISLNWLKEFVEINENVGRVAEILTMGGIEVENIIQVGQGLGDVLTARIERISPHPNAENLTLVTLQTGAEERTVVCGAPNVRVGQMVPYCPSGGCLPSGLRLEDRVIKGVPSPGMICSEKELDLGDDESGILELAKDTPVGLPLPHAFPYIEDHILEISVTPNRGDCLSVLGIARELAALTNNKWKVPVFDIKEASLSINEVVRVDVPDSDLCPRYVVRVVEGAAVAPSPLEIRLKLSRSGIRPISNIVDVTNLVLLECGQPLHAFDLATLENNRIVVRKADPNERFTTLDGVERALPRDALMIRDGERSVALAGIMGGLNSEISPATSSVLIESACFERFGIRRTAKMLGMMTEASYRFERGVDPEGTLWAAHRAAYLIQRLAGGRILKGVIDVYPIPIRRHAVRLRTAKVNGLLGIHLTTSQIGDHLKRLEIEVLPSPESTDVLICRPPSWRWDLEREVDLIEEVARIHGFDRIPISMPSYISAPDRTKDDRKKLRTVDEAMKALGFTEIITMSFVSKAVSMNFLRKDTSPNFFELVNPLTEEMAVMRRSLLPGLLAAAVRNVHFKCVDLKLYEMGKVFRPVQGMELPHEDLVLGALAMGRRYPDLWHFHRGEVDIYGKIDANQQADFYDLKGALETLLALFSVPDATFAPCSEPFLHAGKSAELLVEGAKMGFVGELAPSLIREYDLPSRALVFEIFLEPLFVHWRKKRVFKALPRYPYVERDISMLVETNCSGDQIKHLISRLGHGIITSVNLFDLYRGESIPEGRQSMAFRIRYQAEDRTLTDEEVSAVHSSIVTALQEELGVAVRE